MKTPMQEIEEYFNSNPRSNIPEGLKDFYEFAKEYYKERDNVNWTYSDDMEEQMEEVDEYIGDCSEALLLAKKFFYNLARKEAEEKQKEFIEKIANKKKDTIHNIEVCQEGIKLKDKNLEYHRWNLSAQEVLLTLLLNLEADFGGKE